MSSTSSSGAAAFFLPLVDRRVPLAIEATDLVSSSESLAFFLELLVDLRGRLAVEATDWVSLSSADSSAAFLAALVDRLLGLVVCTMGSFSGILSSSFLLEPLAERRGRLAVDATDWLSSSSPTPFVALLLDRRVLRRRGGDGAGVSSSSTASSPSCSSSSTGSFAVLERVLRREVRLFLTLASSSSSACSSVAFLPRVLRVERLLFDARVDSVMKERSSSST